MKIIETACSANIETFACDYVIKKFVVPRQNGEYPNSKAKT
jgi:hypothetical protein